MALAAQPDVEARLGRQLAADEAQRALALLDDASALVVGWTGRDFEPAPYPTPVVGVVAQMVARVLRTADVPDGVQSQGAGPFSVTMASGAGPTSPWLSAADKLALRPYRGGVTSVGLYSERYSVDPTTGQVTAP